MKEKRNYAHCRMCCIEISVRIDGFKAVIQHAKGAKHKRNVAASKVSKVMQNFFPKEHTAEENMVTAIEVCKHSII